MSKTEIIYIKTISDAENELRKIGVDKGGYKFLIPKALSFTIKIKEVKPIPANILKQEMLSLGGDAAVNRGVITHKAEKSDILLIGNLAQYLKLIYKLKMQQFGLPDIAHTIEEALKQNGVEYET